MLLTYVYLHLQRCIWLKIARDINMMMIRADMTSILDHTLSIYLIQEEACIFNKECDYVD